MNKHILSKSRLNGLIIGAIIIIGLIIRILIYFALDRAGWFYGIPWDTFSRTYLAWQWAQHPYFAARDVYWPPLQFWLIGVIYVVLRPLIGNTSSLLVPVAVNNLFFVGSLLVISLVTRAIGGTVGVAMTTILAVTLAADVFVSYSALADPIYIFFILLGSWLIFRRWLSRTFPLELGLVGWATTATHYIGWFAGLFWIGVLGWRGSRSLLRRDAGGVAGSLVGILLIVAFPVLWMFKNWQVWNDPFHFLEIAKNYQAGYVGSLPVFERVLVVPATLLQNIGFLIPAGILAGLWLMVQGDRRLAIFASTTIWVFGCVWITTAAGMSAPYQEPRYLLLVGWILIPMLCGALSQMWTKGSWLIRMGLIVIVLGLAAAGLIATFRFSNSFDADVRNLGLKLGAELRRSPDSKVVVEVDSDTGLGAFAERGVVPVVSGFPNHFEFVSGVTGDQLASHARLGDFVVTKSLDKAVVLLANGFEVEQIGKYFVGRRIK